MITSQHIVFIILCVTILHYVSGPRHTDMKVLLYLKQLFNERCQVKALFIGDIPGVSILNHLNKMYCQFNNVNVTVCQSIDLSIPGKPSAQFIAGMSHPYMRNFAKKYFTKSSLVNELLIESILDQNNQTELSAHASLDHLWIYLPLALFVVYPFFHDRTVFCCNLITSYLFGLATISNNGLIPESTTEELNNEPATQERTTSRRSSTTSSIGSIHLDYTNYAAYNETIEELLAAKENKANDPAKPDADDTANKDNKPAKKRDEHSAGPSKPQRFQPAGSPSKPSKASRPASIPGSSKSTATAAPSTLTPGPSKRRTSPAGPSKPTSPHKFPAASRPSKIARSTRHFAAKKQSVNDLADRVSAFFKFGGFTAPDRKKKPSATSSSAKPPTLRNDAPTPDKPSLPSTETDSLLTDALTEALADAPFMPPEKTQPKKAPIAVKLSFSRFKIETSTSTNDPPTDVSNAADVSSAAVPQNQPSYASGPSRVSNPPPSSTTDRNKKDMPPKSSSLFPKPKLAYLPGSLRSPTAKTTTSPQVKRAASAFPLSSKEFKVSSGIRTLADASTRRHRGNIETLTTTYITFGGAASDTKTTPTQPVSLMSNPPSVNRDQERTVETELVLNQSNENFFTTALGTAQILNPDENFFAPALTTIAPPSPPPPLNPDPSSAVALSKNTMNCADLSGNDLVAAFFASDLQVVGTTPHVLESNEDDRFEFVGLLVAGTTEPFTAPPPPPTATIAGVDKEESKEAHIAAIAAGSSASEEGNPKKTQQATDNVADTLASSAAVSNGQSSSNDESVESSWLAKRNVRTEERYAAKIAAMFPLTTSEELDKDLAGGMYNPLLGSDTPLYTSIYRSATATATTISRPSTTRQRQHTVSQQLFASQQCAVSSSGTGSTFDRSPILLVNTDNLAAKQDADGNRLASSLLICQSAKAEEVYPSEGLLQSLKQQAKERAIQQANQESNQQESTKSKKKGKGKNNKKKKKRGKRR